MKLVCSIFARSMARYAIFPLLLFGALLFEPNAGAACSCAWNGGFLKVVPSSDTLIWARVRNYAEKACEMERAMDMDVEVLAVLRGKVKPDTLRIRGDNGMLCRPDVEQFAIGSQYIFALNGAGSKPGYDGGPAISICGQHWLDVQGDKVIGEISPERQLGEHEELTFGELLQALEREGVVKGKNALFIGEVRGGEEYRRKFGEHFLLTLQPLPLGWRINVLVEGSEEDIGRLTPPFHGVPNPCEIEGWHFRISDNTGPDEPGEKNVNAPQQRREFIFSPEVGKTIDGAQAKSQPTAEEIDWVKQFGKGTLTLLEYRLTDLEPGKRAKFEWLRFAVHLKWVK
jgi:hypothetical protein